MVAKCISYFEHILLSELRFRYWTTAAETVVEHSAQSKNNKYSCQGLVYVDMVRCDEKHCTRRWFHFQCVNLKRVLKWRK